mgnify:CR=1 FL=1
MLRAGSYLIPTVLAVILHAAVVVLLAQSWFEHSETSRTVPRHVQAQIVDLKSQKAQSQAAAQAKARKKADEQRKIAADKKRKADAKRKKEVAAKKAADKKRKQDVARKKAAAEKQRQLDKKKQQDIARKKAADKKKAAADKKRKAEQAVARRKEAERVAAAKEAKENAEALEAAEQAALQQALEEEEAAIQAEQSRASAQSYENYIIGEITRNWRRSPSARNGMVVEVTVHLLPSGRVNDAYISKSSGDTRFDNDALRAIQRVGTFEKLQQLDSVTFDRYFRKRVLRFRPEDLRN